MKNGATTSFLNLLRFNFPQTNNHIPLVIEIKELDITRNKTDNFDSISGQMELVFHSQINELIMELYSTKQSFAKKSFDGIKDIEEEIRNCIRLSFNEFIENNYETIIDYKKINSNLESAPIYTGNIILHKEYKEESRSKDEEIQNYKEQLQILQDKNFKNQIELIETKKELTEYIRLLDDETSTYTKEGK